MYEFVLLVSLQTPLIIYLFHFVVDYAEITFMVSRKRWFRGGFMYL